MRKQGESVDHSIHYTEKNQGKPINIVSALQLRGVLVITFEPLLDPSDACIDAALLNAVRFVVQFVITTLIE